MHENCKIQYKNEFIFHTHKKIISTVSNEKIEIVNVGFFFHFFTKSKINYAKLFFVFQIKTY